MVIYNQTGCRPVQYTHSATCFWLVVIAVMSLGGCATKPLWFTGCKLNLNAEFHKTEWVDYHSPYVIKKLTMILMISTMRGICTMVKIYSTIMSV